MFLNNLILIFNKTLDFFIINLSYIYNIIIQFSLPNSDLIDITLLLLFILVLILMSTTSLIIGLYSLILIYILSIPIFIYLAFDFYSYVLILIYVGAISVFFKSVIMTCSDATSPSDSSFQLNDSELIFLLKFTFNKLLIKFYIIYNKLNNFIKIIILFLTFFFPKLKFFINNIYFSSSYLFLKNKLIKLILFINKCYFIFFDYFILKKKYDIAIIKIINISILCYKEIIVVAFSLYFIHILSYLELNSADIFSSLLSNSEYNIKLNNEEIFIFLKKSTSLNSFEVLFQEFSSEFIFIGIILLVSTIIAMNLTSFKKGKFSGQKIKSNK